MNDKKIEDFGEKIEGARKDLAALRKGTLQLTGEMVDNWSSKEKEQYISKDLVWKRPGYQEMVNEGYSKEIVYFIKSVRDAIPAKPPVLSEEGIKGYISFVQYIKESIGEVTSFDSIRSFRDDLIEQYLVDSGYHYYKAKPESYECFQNKLLKVLYKTEGTLKNEVRSKEFCYTEDEHLENVYIQAIFTPSQFNNFDLHHEVRQQGTEHEYGFLDIYARTAGRFGGSTKIIRIQDENRKCPDMSKEDFKEDKYYVVSNKNELLFRDIDSKEEATRLAIEWAKAAEQLKNPEQEKVPRSHKEKLLPPQLEHIRREGESHREKNLDVSGEDILESFKLRGGQFGNWTNQNDRQVNMNMLFDSFRDLAVALNISYGDISLNKNNDERTASLGIAWGARGHSGALAHYEPVENVINLTKMRGAGSLAHEWGHALDCYIKEMYGLRASSDSVKAQKFMATHCIGMENPFIDTINAMRIKHHEDGSHEYTDYYKESKKTDGEYAKTDNGYWTSACEMFARAFSCYVADKLKEKGIRSDYLTGHSESTVYPKGDERIAINKAIDKLIDDLKERGYLHHQEHDIQAEAKKKPVAKLVISENPEPVPVYEDGEQLSFFDMTDNEPEQSVPSAEEVETYAADRQLPSSLDLPNWKINYIHHDAPEDIRTYNTKSAWETLPLNRGNNISCEEMGMHDLSLFRDKAMNGIILQYEVVEGDCSDFMKPWTADELGETLERNTGETDICRCTIYNDAEQRITCIVKVQDMGDEELQIVTNVIKSDKDENGKWQQTYNKDYYCENEEFKNISINDFVLLNYRDYGALINDAVNFAESGKEQLYSPPRNAGNYKCFNGKYEFEVYNGKGI